MDRVPSSPVPVEALLSSIGRAVEERRRELDFSQERLARMLNVHRNTIYRIENGYVDATVELSSRIYRALGTSGVRLEDGLFRFIESQEPQFIRLPEMPDESVRREIGRAIASRRIDLGFSQERLAERADLHRNTIGNIERGEVGLVTSSLFRIYTSLGVSTVTLRSGRLVLD